MTFVVKHLSCGLVKAILINAQSHYWFQSNMMANLVFAFNHMLGPFRRHSDKLFFTRIWDWQSIVKLRLIPFLHIRYDGIGRNMPSALNFHSLELLPFANKLRVVGWRSSGLGFGPGVVREARGLSLRIPLPPHNDPLAVKIKMRGSNSDKLECLLFEHYLDRYIYALYGTFWYFRVLKLMCASLLHVYSISDVDKTFVPPIPLCSRGYSIRRCPNGYVRNDLM